MEPSSGVKTTSPSDSDALSTETATPAVEPTSTNVVSLTEALAKRAESGPTSKPASTVAAATGTAPKRHRFEIDDMELCKKTYGLETDNIGLSDRFVAQAEGKLIYNVDLDLWSIWTGKVWEADPAALAVDALAAKIAYSIKTVELQLALKADGYMIELETRATAARKELEGVDTKDAKTQLAAAESAPGKYADRLKRDAKAASEAAQRPQTRADVIRLARGALSSREAEWGGPADKINCQNGVVDLRTGEVTPHDPKLLMRQITPVNYVPGARHEYLEQVLEHLSAGDSETRVFMKRMYGTACTGETSHRAFYFIYGPAQVGKSTLSFAVMSALGLLSTGGYTAVLETSALMVSKSSHQEGLDGARGARFGMVEEADTSSGVLDVALINKLTSGNLLNTRGIYGKGSYWQPQITMVMTSNPMLQIQVENEGLQARFIPMKVTTLLPPNKRKAEVTEVLMHSDEGREATLAYLIEGAMEMYADGFNYSALGVPAHLEQAKDTYRDEIDHVLAWIQDDMIQVNPDHTEGYPMTAKQVNAAFQSWLTRNQKRFPPRELFPSLERKGYAVTKKDSAGKFKRWPKIEGRKFSETEEYPPAKQFVLGLYPEAGVNAWEGNFRGADLLAGNVPLDPEDQKNYPGSNLHLARAA